MELEKRIRELDQELWFVQTVLEVLVHSISHEDREALLRTLETIRRETAELFRHPTEYERSRNVLDRARVFLSPLTTGCSIFEPF